MAATGPANFYAYGDKIDFTPAVAATAGAVVLQNDLAAFAPVDLVVARKAGLQVVGLFQFNKDASTFFAGQRVYFDMVNLVATSDPTKGPILGVAMLAQLTGDATVYVLCQPPHNADSYYVRSSAGAAVTNTVTETTLDSCNFPANRLQVNDVIRFRAQGIVTAHNASDTLTIKGYLGSVQLFTTGAVTDAANDIYVVEGDITIRAIGGPATGLIVGGGNQSLGAPGTATQKVWNVAATNMDTTVAQLFKLTATWSAANAGDSVRADHCCVELLRQQ